ncbi:MAG: hypothetical protein HYX92_08215 [Chloroflexi bacterium]|nr:hypothetical protein [Chloroflexota bacterium]
MLVRSFVARHTTIDAPGLLCYTDAQRVRPAAGELTSGADKKERIVAREAFEEAKFHFESDCEAINNLFFERGWTDGLPVIPPTEEAVGAMLSGAGRDRSEILGKIPPNWAYATVEKVAVNAVMAGCLPGYLPVVIAAVEAMVEEPFNLHGMQATTHGCAPLVIVNGPIRKELNINCRYNCFGPGWRANATIGRALRLILTNVGGGIPGITDRSTTGMPSKYTYCIGENEEESPWEPLHVEKGYRKEENVVTVAPGDGPHDILDRSSTTAIGVLTTIAHAMGALGSGNTLIFAENILALGPEHAETVAREGYTKGMVRQFAFENAGLPLSWYGPEVGPWRKRQLAQHGIHVDGEDRVPIVEKLEDITIVVTGGAGKHSAYIGGLAAMHPVTKPIHVPKR